MKQSMMEKLPNHIFVIFGGTGDLTKRKLVPAFYNLFQKGRLGENFKLVLIGRRDYSDEEYFDILKQSMLTMSGKDVDNEDWFAFCKLLYYKKFDFEKDIEMYANLKEFLKNLDKKTSTPGNRIFYLAVSPELMGSVVENLNSYGLIENNIGWQRVMVEKPFGTSLKSAIELHKQTSKVLPEEKIFRIDHYLGKEMIQNILSIRFANSIFEPLWNKNFVSRIEVVSGETIGVETRGAYYEKSGILRDMLQNHILQVISLICMEPPEKLTAKSIIDSKVKVMKELRHFDKKSATENIVLGQYGPGEISGENVVGYRQEDRVDEDSNIPTYVAIKLNIDNDRWKDIPILVSSGKRLKSKGFDIRIVFKKSPITQMYSDFDDASENSLFIKIQPYEGMTLNYNIKNTGSDYNTKEIALDCSNECICKRNSPEAYERIIVEAILNNSAIFTRWDELIHSWEYIENIEKSLEGIDFNFPNYKAGTIGPAEAKKILKWIK